MADSRVEKLAKVLINYSLSIQAGEELLIWTSSLAEELNDAVYREALQAGALVTVILRHPAETELLLKHGNDAQITYISPLHRYVTEEYRAMLYIEAPFNTRRLSGVDPANMSQYAEAGAELMKVTFDRAARGDFKWTLTVSPCNALAQEANMSLSEYEEFVYGAGLLDLEDPVAGWQEELARQRRLIAWLAGKSEVTIKGANVDMTFSIKGRTFAESAGHQNFPSGEIFTAPVEDSCKGWIRFGYPAIYSGREVEDVELWFDGGKVVEEKAGKGHAFLTEMLNTDAGSRYLGEWGIGTNYGIRRFTKNMLFDEKMGGTMHLALGSTYPETGGVNESGIHWDMLCDMAESQIHIDGELFYEDGNFAV